MNRKRLLTASLAVVLVLLCALQTLGLTSTRLYAATTTTTVKSVVSAFDDDCNQSGSSFVNNTSTLWIGDNRDVNASYAGIRFAGVSVPRGATVQSASLRMYSVAASSSSLKVILYGDNSGNSARFSGTSLPSGRARTGASVNYASPSAWAANTWYSVDVTPIVREIVNRGDWTKGNALSLLVKGASGTQWARRGVKGDTSSDQANVPQLVISYSAAASPSPTPLPPTATSVPPTATRVPPTATARPTATVAPTATARPTATPSGTGFSKPIAHDASFFSSTKAYLRAGDIMRATAIRGDKTVAVQKGDSKFQQALSRLAAVNLAGVHKAITFSAVEDVRNLMPYVPADVDIVEYNLEGGMTPDADYVNVAQSAIQFAQIVHQYGRQASFGPIRSMWDTLARNGSLASVVKAYDYVGVQEQSTWAASGNDLAVLVNDVKALSVQMKAANPNVRLEVQLWLASTGRQTPDDMIRGFKGIQSYIDVAVIGTHGDTAGVITVLKGLGR